MKTDQYEKQIVAQTDVKKQLQYNELRHVETAIQLRIANALERIADKMELDEIPQIAAEQR